MQLHYLSFQYFPFPSKTIYGVLITVRIDVGVIFA